MEYRDTFEPRPFQAEVIEKVMDGFATGRAVTVALGTPGTGKTLTYQAAATHLLREGLIDHLAVFVPRVNLARDCENSWMARPKNSRTDVGFHLLFDSALRFGKIRHTAAIGPLTSPGATGVGFVSTYAALALDSDQVFLDWAREHQGRFLLVADEAQFCGGDSDRGGEGGTQAGARIHELSGYAAHTLLLTGTPYRADGKKLVLCTYSDPDEDGKQYLNKHVEATYADGIDGSYLRRFEMTLYDGTITENAVDDTWSVDYKVSSRDGNLAPVLRVPTTWAPLVDLVVQGVREKQALHPKYRGLISCMESRDADAVANYLRQRYPGLRVFKAVSADGEAARKALEDFRLQDADILVTVRMAFIGYDCKQITVVGVLTHYRDPGHLMQLVGRGLRVWDALPYAEQTCRIIAPDDEKMNAFLDQLREEQDEGVRRRETRERGDGEQRPAAGDTLSYIAATQMNRIRAVSNDAEVDHDDRILLEAGKREYGLVDDVTKLAGFAEFLGMRLKDAYTGRPEPEVAVAAEPVEVLTEQQHIDSAHSQTAEQIRVLLRRRGIDPGHAEYSKHVAKTTAQVNRLAGCNSREARTIEQAEARLRVAKMLASEQ